MLPVNTVFPEFVPDQLLTSDDLNELFGYLDEQGRLTRTNLIGIGIVCGLEVQTNNTGTSLTITKGCGVTSEGYLVTVPTITYTEFNVFDAVTERYYDRFVNIAAKTQTMDLWELKQAAVDPDATNLSQEFLRDKVVMIFVELLEEDNKNCDPNSCDDKGVHVTVSFRPLLVTIADAEALVGAQGGSLTVDTFTGLPEIKMPRFDVPNTNPVSTQHIFDAYKSILSAPFLTRVQTALGQAHTLFFPFVSAEFPVNPFAGMAASFAFINNGSINLNQLIHLQYYYDLFSDLLQGYDEFRKTGRQILSTCCPDSSLFPRHLLLGEAIPAAGNVKSAFRHYFIYSPLFEQKNFMAELKILFRKIVALRNQFFLPPVNNGPATGSDPFIRITPSKLGDVLLSQKAIPYYYLVTTGVIPLFRLWSFEKSIRNIAEQNLSYHANQYNATDDFVLHPLKYELEPYNFLRIEGIVGKPYVSVLSNIKRQILANRLPFTVIALGTDDYRLYNNGSFTSFNNDVQNKSELSKMLCHFQDLEALYETIKGEMLCTLCKELKYYYDFQLNYRTAGAAPGLTAKPGPSKVSLFSYCSPGYQIQPGSFGVMIEKVYDHVGDEGEINVQSIAAGLGIESLFTPDDKGDGPAKNFTSNSVTLLANAVAMFRIPIYIIRLSKTFTADLATFDADEYCVMYQKLSEEAASLKFLFNIFTASERQAIRDHALGISSAVASTSKGASPAEEAAVPPSLRTSMMRAFGVSSLALTQTNAGRILLLIFLLEDFFDHLDALIYNCKCSALKALKREYLKRYVYLDRLMQFGYYIKLHPGIQHKAGVPMGGTFIVVYHRRKRASRPPTINQRFVIRGVVMDEDREPLPGATIRVKGTAKGAVTDVTGHFSITVNALPLVLEVAFIGFEPKEVELTSDEPVEIIMGDLTIGDNIVDRIPEGTVIADFYLPYLCCADCPPVQFVVKELTERPPVNRGPVVNAGPDLTITLPVNAVTLNGTASDPDGTIVSFRWTKLRGPAAFELLTPESAQTGVRALVEGEYEFELTVQDDKGDAARDTAMVTVLPAPPENRPPVADAGDDRTIRLSPNNPLLLDGSKSSDPDGRIISYFWEPVEDRDAPSIPVLISPNADKTFVTGLKPGNYQFKLTVRDDKGAVDDDTVSIIVVEPPNEPPSANAGDDFSITLPQNTARLMGSGSDPESGNLAYAWSLVSKPAGAPDPVIGNLNFAQTQVAGLREGTYEFELKVTDDKGASATDRVMVTVNTAPARNRPPVAVAGTNRLLSTGSPVELDGTGSSDEDGRVEKFRWKQVEGPAVVIVAPDQPVTRTDNLPDGRYKFELRVVDDKQTESSPDFVYVWVRKESNLRKSCFPLSSLPPLFKEFPAFDRENFQLFQQQFGFFDEVSAFFERLNEIVNKTEADQLAFFIDLRVDESMSAWLQRLLQLCKESSENKRVRLLALRLIRMLSGLMMYIVCIQKEDINEARLKMEDAVHIIALIRRLEPAFINANFTTQELKEFRLLEQLFNDELNRLLRSPEAVGKPLYFHEVSDIVIYFQDINTGS
jgi:hypothetical protein